MWSVECGVWSVACVVCAVSAVCAVCAEDELWKHESTDGGTGKQQLWSVAANVAFQRLAMGR